MAERLVALDTPPARGADAESTAPASPEDAAWARSPPTLVVPPTPSGVATALTHAAAAHRTTGPERSHPAWRDHPPLVEFGERSVPDAVRAATPETGIELRLPASLDRLFVAAPLAYYLGAEVTVEPDAEPVLAAPAAGLVHRFDPATSFEQETASLLRRCFFLDSLVRDVEGETLAGRESLLGALGLDPSVRERSPAARLAAYIDVAPESVEPHLPEWHLSSYVEPDLERARSLPHLLDAMSLVYLPEASELDRRERLQRSLDDFYRSAARAPSVDVLSPSLHAGDVHAWLADGTPIDACKVDHSAFEHRLRYADPDRCRVAVVCNDESMAAERAVAEIYRERTEGLPVEVTVHESLRRAELARLFETPHEFVHYIGHCDVDGLRCPDGNLAASELEEVRARTFFLNACGSYHEGRALVENGSAAGAVTLTSVLDEQAATVGTTFARLVVGGFSVARALSLARRRIMMGKDYAVVGDGTCSVVPRADADAPAVLRLTPEGDAFRARYEVATGRSPGESHHDPLADETRLHGTTTEVRVERAELVSFLRRHSLPVVNDGEFVWSDDLAARLATD